MAERSYSAAIPLLQGHVYALQAVVGILLGRLAQDPNVRADIIRDIRVVLSNSRATQAPTLTLGQHTSGLTDLINEGVRHTLEGFLVSLVEGSDADDSFGRNGFSGE